MGELQHEVTRANFRTWLQPTGGLLFEHGVFVVGVPSIFAREWLGKRWQPLIKRTLAKLLGQEVGLEFRIVQPGAEPEAPVPAIPLPDSLNPRYTFENFVVGEGNRMAYSSLLVASERPGKTYNPLFLYGASGTGKTHLLQALGHRAVQQGYRLLYATPERLASEFITAIRHRTTEELKQSYRQADLMVVDDIHLLEGKRQTQKFFFQTFEELHQASRQLVVASDRLPHALPLEERLRSRFQSGLVVDIHPPGQATRQAILQQRAQQLTICLDAPSLELLASHGQGSVRELEGYLHRAVAYAQLHQVPLSPEVIRQALAFQSCSAPEAALGAGEILMAVARTLGVTLEQMRGPGRSRQLSRARQVAAYLLREKLGWSLERIGQELGGRDHSSVLYAYRRVAQSQGQHPQVQEVLAALQAHPGASARAEAV